MKHNYHSTNNQRVLGKLVDREVMANQSYLVTELLSHHYDEAEWTNEYEDNSEEIDELMELKNKYEDVLYDIDDKIEEYADRLEEAIKDNNFSISKSVMEDKVRNIEEQIEELEKAIKDNNFSIQEKYKNKIDILTSSKSIMGDKISDIEEQIEEIEQEQEPKEVLEWWLVTGWFEEKLKNYGEVFVEIFGETWWGRTCSGQAILLDYVIGKIGGDMEILEGQNSHRFWVN